MNDALTKIAIPRSVVITEAKREPSDFVLRCAAKAHAEHPAVLSARKRAAIRDRVVPGDISTWKEPADAQ